MSIPAIIMHHTIRVRKKTIAINLLDKRLLTQMLPNAIANVGTSQIKHDAKELDQPY